MIEARKAGATIVTVDPYQSPTARRSDWHIQPRPGTDAALALGIMHVIWRDGLQDDEYLKQGHRRRRALRRRVMDEYPPEKVAAITGVDVATITTFAHRLAANSPRSSGSTTACSATAAAAWPCEPSPACRP